MNTDLELVSKALTDYDRVAAGLDELSKSYKGVVYAVMTTSGLEEAKAARAAIRDPRFEVERVRKEAKAPILALGKQIDARAKEITGKLLEIETPIDNQIKAEEERKERERQAKIEAEVLRVNTIQSRLAQLRGGPNLYLGRPSAEIAKALQQQLDEQIGDDYMEFKPHALLAKAEAVTAFQAMHAAAVGREAEAAELTRLRAAQALRDQEDAQRHAEQVAENSRLREQLAESQAREAQSARELAARPAAATPSEATQPPLPLAEVIAPPSAPEQPASGTPRYPGKEAVLAAAVDGIVGVFGISSERATLWLAEAINGRGKGRRK